MQVPGGKPLQRAHVLRPWLNRQGLLQARIDRQHHIKTKNAHDAQDTCGRHHQPQLGTAGDGMLVGQHQRTDSARVTKRCRRHIRDHDGDSGSKGCLKLGTDTVSVGHVDLGGQRDYHRRGRELCLGHQPSPPGTRRRDPGDGCQARRNQSQDRGWLVNRWWLSCLIQQANA